MSRRLGVDFSAAAATAAAATAVAAAAVRGAAVAVAAAQACGEVAKNKWKKTDVSDVLDI